MVADELRRQADNFIELQDMSSNIARVHPHREAGPGETNGSPVANGYYDAMVR